MKNTPKTGSSAPSTREVAARVQPAASNAASKATRDAQAEHAAFNRESAQAYRDQQGKS
jgi:hypothetical protein